MNAYILVIVFYGKYLGSGEQIQMQEFNSRQTCESARESFSAAEIESNVKIIKSWCQQK